MQTAVKLPLRSLNPNLISDLQKKYPEAELHIVIADASDQATVMNENRFWDILSLLDWSKEGNDDAVLEPAIRALSALSESAIVSFYDLLSEKLYLLDGRVYAEYSVPEHEGVSSDLFLYARCGVVAQGQTYYENVLKNPDAFPQLLYFEALLYLPERAWFRKTGNEFEAFPKYIFETGFNPNGWGADSISL
jgi:hypothetical protein